jgi:hypothetical protein
VPITVRPTVAPTAEPTSAPTISSSGTADSGSDSSSTIIAVAVGMLFTIQKRALVISSAFRPR